MQATARRTRWILLAAVAVFAVLKLVHALLAITRNSPHGIDGPRLIYATDTNVYLGAAHSPIWSWGFLAARGPFGYALFLKVVASNSRAAVVLQTVLSIGAWIFLAYTARAAMHREWPRTLAFVGVLATGLAPALMMWDAAVLTESIAISLVCVVIALALRLAIEVTTTTVVMFSAALAAAALTRDVDAFIAGLIGIVAASCLFAPRIRAAHWRHLIAVSVVCVTTAVVAIGLSTHARRSFWAVGDSIAVHIGGDPHAYKWFVAHGMPNDGAARTLFETRPYGRDALARDVAPYQALHHWLATDGPNTYTSYLLSHPRWTLRAPLSSLQALFAPSIEFEARYSGNDPDIVSRTIGTVGLPPIVIDGVWATLAAAGMLWILVRKPVRRRDRRVAYVLLVTGALALPHAWAVFHGDAYELERHAVSVVAQARLAVWIATAWVVDQIAVARSTATSRETG